jgi:hypothetical protein
MLKINRRQMIQLLGAGTASIYLGGCATWSNKSGSKGFPSWVNKIGPVDRSMGDKAQREFTGDRPTKAHEILWHKAEFIKSQGGFPETIEDAELIIVGAGMSGLLSAYFLRDLNPLLLEQAPRLGGNSRAESWRGLDYSLATAYFTIPDEGSEIQKFFQDLGIDKIYRAREVNDPIFIDGKRYDDIWNKGTNSQNQKQFQKLKKLFLDTVNNENGARYPEMPFIELTDQMYVEKLDRISFKDYLENHLKEKLHPHVENVIEYYFWSAAACSSTEVSAAAGLNFFAADFGAIAVTEGGNAAIAERVVGVLSKTMAPERFRVNSLVFDVRYEKDRILVSYWNGDRIKTVRAKAVVMSCPKFIAGRVIEGLEPERLKIYKTLRYRSYMLGNLLVDQSVDDSFYDLFFFKEGVLDTKKVRESANHQRITDLVYGNYAKPDQPQTVLTLFRGFPYDEARSEVLVPEAYEKYRAEFEKQIQEEVLPQLKIDPKKVVDLRISRWGHPLPLAEKGTVSSGKVQWLRKPFGNRVFFAEQDNWMLPAFETCFFEAQYWAPEVRAALKG